MGVIKFVDMILSFFDYKLYKILLDFIKYNVRYYVTETVVKVWVDLDPDHQQGFCSQHHHHHENTVQQ